MRAPPDPPPTDGTRLAAGAGPPAGRAGGLLRSRAALWTSFALVHAWLTVVGVALAPTRAFWDVDLYRHWAALALDADRWPVLDDAWVYPAGALVPVLAPALTGTRSTAGYALAWCAGITVLDAVAVGLLVRAGRAARAGDRFPRGRPVPAGAWWWIAFLLALGPVAVGRLDAVVAPLCVAALTVAAHRPALAAVLLTAGAWVKVAPGALLLPLAAVARRPWRTVVLPAAAVCTVVVGTVAAAGGLPRLGGFVTEQARRGLQAESVAATPWVLAGLADDRVRIGFDERLSTWEVTGPGTTATAAVLGVALPAAVVGVATLLARSRGRLRRRPPARPGTRDAVADDVLLWGALAVSTLLVVANKVGSPQLVGWLAAPVAVALTVTGAAARRRWRRAAVAVLLVAALTQVVFPLGADGVVAGDPASTAALAARNAGLVVVLAVALRRLSRAAA